MADDHDLRIIRARQRCQPVMYKGLKQYIGTYAHHDGDAEMTIYLKGLPDPVRPSEITILKPPE